MNEWGWFAGEGGRVLSGTKLRCCICVCIDAWKCMYPLASDAVLSVHAVVLLLMYRH